MRDLDAFSLCAWDVALGHQLPPAAHDLAGAFPAAVLRTCQRTEVYQSAPCSCDAPLRLQGLDALRHLGEVAAGLHSVVCGETQVLGQVRSAWEGAPPALGWFGEVAIASARRLRDRHALHADTGELLDRALAHAGMTPWGRVLVIGTGVLGRRVAARAEALGFSEVNMAGRTRPATMPAETGWISLSDLANAQPVDVLVTCLGSGAPPLAPERLPAVTALSIDLGTPPNLACAPRVPLVTIGDLALAAARGPDPRCTALQRELHSLIDDRLRADASPESHVVGAMRSRVEALRQVETARIRRLHPELDAAVIEAITSSLVNRIFHAPSERLRALGDAQLAERVAALFAAEEHV